MKEKEFYAKVLNISYEDYPTYEEAKEICGKNGIKKSNEYKEKRKKLNLPSAPDDYYKNKGWIDWYDFLGKQSKDYPTYEEAKEINEKNGIKLKDEYNKKYKELNLPSAPNVYYKQEWIDWGEFLGNNFPTYEEAKEICRKNNIKKQVEYNKKRKELNLPSAPHDSYKKEWIDWGKFLGNNFPTYEEAKEICGKNGIKKSNEYKEKRKKLNLPSNPNDYYKNKGWIDWYDFLGKQNKNYPTYEESKKICEKNGIVSSKQYNKKLYKKLNLPSAPYNYYKEEWIDWHHFLGKTK